MVNLLSWARTGTETPMYASAESRNADIEAGAGLRVSGQADGAPALPPWR